MAPLASRSSEQQLCQPPKQCYAHVGAGSPAGSSSSIKCMRCTICTDCSVFQHKINNGDIIEGSLTSHKPRGVACPTLALWQGQFMSLAAAQHKAIIDYTKKSCI
jgi:hypothetical protein